MSAQPSPQEMFPNLFGQKPAAKRQARELAPADLRLVQYLMRQHGTRRAPQPSRLAPQPAAPRRPLAAKPAPRPLPQRAR